MHNVQNLVKSKIQKEIFKKNLLNFLFLLHVYGYLPQNKVYTEAFFSQEK